MRSSQHAEDIAKLLIQVYKGRSEVANLIGENKRAIEDIRKGIKLSKIIKDKKLLADCLMKLSDIHGSASKYDEMQNFTKESLEIYLEINNKKGIADSLNNIGSVHNSLGDYPKALEYYNRSLKIKEEIGDCHR